MGRFAARSATHVVAVMVSSHSILGPSFSAAQTPSLPFDGEARPAREAELPHDGVGTPFGSGRSSPIGDGEKARYEHQQDGRECECSGQSLDAEIGHRKRSSRLVGYRGQPSSTQAPAARGSAKSAAA